jgi:hypothetical protein
MQEKYEVMESFLYIRFQKRPKSSTHWRYSLLINLPVICASYMRFSSIVADPNLVYSAADHVPSILYYLVQERDSNTSLLLHKARDIQLFFTFVCLR